MATFGCDVLVIGSGPVGAIYARHLVAAGLSVAMVDAGPQLGPVPGEHLRNRYLHHRDLQLYHDARVAHLYPPSVPVAEPLFPGEAHLPPRAAGGNPVNPEQDPRRSLPGAAVTYAVGGMGVLWTCLAPRLHPEVERFPFFAAAEWEGLYARAEAELRVGRETFRGSRRGAALLARLEAAGRTAELAPVAAWRREDDPRQVHWTGPGDLLGPALAGAGGGRLHLLPQHVATRLHHQGGRVSAATVASLDPWAELTVRAELFVVAAGALLSPQLLWVSGILREDEGPLGRYLHDHPLAYAQVALAREIVEAAGGIAEDDPDPFLAIPIEAGRPFHGLLLADAYDARVLEGGLDERRVLNLYWYALAEPRRENRITWSAERTDLHGLPQPTFHYALSPEARARSREMLADLREVGGLVGAFLPTAPPQLLPAGRSLHFLGTTRMGPEGDGSAVVDLDSRVWGFDNLYVGGTGLFPGPTASNPTLTACALALRSVDRILDRRKREG